MLCLAYIADTYGVSGSRLLVDCAVFFGAVEEFFQCLLCESVSQWVSESVTSWDVFESSKQSGSGRVSALGCAAECARVQVECGSE
jgi:hypothetical protein